MSSQLSCDITAGKCFCLTTSNENIRLLYCDPLNDICYYIPFRERQSTVDHCPLSIFCLQVDDGTYVPIDDPIGERHLNKAEEDERDRRWDAMKELLLDEPNVFDSKKRSLKMHKALKELDVHRSTLLSYLRNYWIGNKNKDALAPDYQHHTSRRNSQVGSSSKLGRPKSDPTHEGKHLTEQDLMNMDITLQKHYLNLNEPSLEHAYTQLVNTYYFREENGKIIRLPPDEIPSKQQLQTRLRNHFAP